MLQAVELCPTEGRGEGEAKKHRVKQNESGDSGIRVLEQDHQADEPDGSSPETKFASGVVRQWHTDDSECSIKDAHKSIVEVLGVCFAGLELERPIVTSQKTGQSNEHLPKRWVYIEVKFAFQIMRAKLSETKPN